MSGLVVKAAADGTYPIAELSPPVRPPPVLPGEPFELGLTSAGAISAGAYIAGVMDLLVQALDSWHAAKEAPALAGLVPDHKVLLRVITGASAGAMNAALLAVLRDRRFTHHATDPNEGGAGSLDAATGNPIFDTWVNRIGIDKLLADKDLADDKAPLSLLDGTALDVIAGQALSDACALPVIQRSWLADPLRVILTQSNSRGVPYFVPFAGSDAGQGMMMHGDQARFAIGVPGGQPGQAPFPDELALLGPPAPATDWARLTAAAVASGAFPVGLPPRQMESRPADYAYKVYFAGENGELVVASPKGPGWPLSTDPAYRQPQPYIGIDGGVIDNDPFGVAHDILAGGCGRNPRSGAEATRSVLMVDPFPAVPDYGPATLAEMSLPNTLTNLLNVTKGQARFRPKDLVLASEEDVFSRFIVVPKKAQPVNGKYSLACGFLGGFGGFVSRRQRVHDFMLGRRNAQKLLMDHMVLPADNPLFDGWRDQPFAATYYAREVDGSIARDDRGQPFLPIIPLLRDGGGITLPPACKIAEQVEQAWPTGAVNPAAVADQVVDRTKALAKYYTGRLGLVARLSARAALSLWGYGVVRSKVRTLLTAAKQKWSL